MTEKKIYIYDKESVAEAVKMTAHYLGFEVTRIGSALLMNEATYESITKLTYAPEAAIVAGELA